MIAAILILAAVVLAVYLFFFDIPRLFSKLDGR